MTTFYAISFCIFLLFTLLRFLHKVWWTPVRVQRIMASQGIKGPSYRFLRGNTKQIVHMKQAESLRCVDLSSHHLFPTILPHLYAWIQLYGKNYLNWHGPQAQLVVTEPELIKEILNNKEGAYTKQKVDGYVKKLLGDGIVVCEGGKWSKLRKVADRAFHGESLKGMIPEMIASVEAMLEKWGHHHEGKEIEVYKEFRLLTSEVISRTAFGSSYLEGEKIFDMLLQLGAIISRNMFKIRFPGIGKFVRSSDDIESDRIEQAIRDLIVGMIKKRQGTVRRGEADDYGSDFLGSLVKDYNDADESSRISMDTVIDECKTFYVGGQETTNGLLAWSILLLSIHTDWQAKAREEVLELFGHKNPNSEGISKLKIMSMIINETLRLYSPVVYMKRRVTREVRLGKLILPTNLEVYIPTLAVHNDPLIWGKDVHLFRPERFAEGVAKTTNNNITAFIPFSFGPRNCVGSNFALTEAKIALSMILQRYKFTLPPSYVHSPIHILTVQPQNGIRIIFRAY